MTALRTDPRDTTGHAEAAAVNDRWNMRRIASQLDYINLELRRAINGSPLDRAPRSAALTEWAAKMAAAAEVVALLDAGRIGTDEARAALYGITGNTDPDGAEWHAYCALGRAQSAAAYVKAASANRAPRVVGV